MAEAQIPTLDQLINFRTKSAADLEETLVAKNWKMLEANEATDSTRASMSFGLGMNSYDDKARMFISYNYSEYSQPNRLSVQINRLSDYQIYLGRLKALGFRLRSSKIMDGGLKKVYMGKTNVITIKSISEEDNDIGSRTITTYHLTIFNIKDYATYFEE